METYRLKGGEGLVSYNNTTRTQYNKWKSEEDKRLGRLMFFGNAMIMKEPMWGQKRDDKQNVLDKEKDAEKYEHSVLEKQSAVVVSLLVDLTGEAQSDETTDLLNE